MSRAVIVGGGAAGMMAAVTAAGQGHQVDLYEKTKSLGKRFILLGKADAI